jgi:hypothetical protein
MCSLLIDRVMSLVSSEIGADAVQLRLKQHPIWLLRVCMEEGKPCQYLGIDVYALLHLHRQPRVDI